MSVAEIEQRLTALEGERAAAFLQSILRELVEHPEELHVEAVTVPERARVHLYVRRNQADTGYLLGRAGRNFEALQTICRAYSGRHKVSVVLTPLVDSLSREGAPSNEHRAPLAV
jgi:predicted RNA-binding protein YlqC (UPF0109 family)